MGEDHPLIKVMRGLFSTSSIGILDQKHVMARMNLEEDFVKAWAKETREMEGRAYRVFKRMPEFNERDESSLAPIWLLS